PIRRRPHGTLWIRTANPCSIKGASMVISSHPMECRTLVVHESSELNHSGRIIAEGSKLFDDNRCMRRGIGLSLKVLPLGVIFLMAWISIGLARLYLRMPVMAVFVILLYLSGVSVPVYHAWSLYCLENHPQEIKTYLSSDSEFKRYQALMSMHEELSNKDLKRLSGDSSARVRLNAIIFAEERRSPLFMEMLFHCVHDPQLNVRTKACHALGQIRGKTARDLLDEVLRADPSWYVRDYAYRAMGRQRPVSMVVREDKRQSGPGQ
ncbi:MAG: HEAT repeat domain-containing protein, partial [Thermodesulfobacteriota bacterium]|nr:HEAT repeat domain-containing protein [Thermodesulfobacteriota bacterium]